MAWNNVIGQERVKNLLKRALEGGRVAHAYLFSGDEGVGKDAVALEFSKALICSKGKHEACDECKDCKRIQSLSHPDVRFVFALLVGKTEKGGDDPMAALSPEQVEEVREQLRQKGNDPYHRITISKATFIKLNSIRQIRKEASLATVEAKKKIFILSNADNMNAEASNALLKTLEEPLPHTVFLLTTSNRDKLLPTIISRCQQVVFDPLSETEIQQALVDRSGVATEQAVLAARMANGSYSRAKDMLSQDMVEERRQTVQFLRHALGKHTIPLMTEIDEVLSGSDRAKTERWLRLLQAWLRDAFILREQGESALNNVDQLEDLKSFVEKLPSADILLAMESVERSIALVGKNVYLPLILTSLAIDLKRDLALRRT